MMETNSKPGQARRQPLRVLIVDDSKSDADLLVRSLRTGGFEVSFQMVDTPADMRAALENKKWDVITSDHAMPQFDGPAALKLAIEICPNVPFIIVSGEIDLNLAVSLMKGGAQDYIHKDELARLTPVVQRLLHDVEAKDIQRSSGKALLVSESRYRRLFETARDGILILDAATGLIEDVNPFLLDLVGYSREEYLGKELWEIGVFKDEKASKAAFLELQRTEYIRYEHIPLQTSSGGSVDVEFVSNVYLVDEKKVIQCNIRDISERRQAEAEIRSLNTELATQVKALQTSEIRYRRLFETAQDGILIVNADTGQINDVNPFLLNLVGHSREEYLNKKVWEIGTSSDIEASKSAFRKLQSRGYVRYEDIPICKNNGGCVDVEFVSNVYMVDHKRVIQCNIRDITERRQTAVAIGELNADLEQRVRVRTAQVETLNKELEMFNYSVSHDLRAPLRQIAGFVTALEEDCGTKLDSDEKQLIQQIRTSTQHMTVLIEALLELASFSSASLRRTPTNLSAIAHDIAAELQQGNPRRPVEFVITEGITAPGDSTLLRIVMDNLLRNAWKFSALRDPARIEFGFEFNTDRGPAYFVRDNGAGFDMKYAGKLFGAFQRLHSQNDFPGTGVGLASVQRIINRHGGQIWAQSSVGQGATFFFMLEAQRKDRALSASAGSKSA
jgi:PAS domain S-box-containing protein